MPVVKVSDEIKLEKKNQDFVAGFILKGQPDVPCAVRSRARAVVSSSGMIACR